MIREGCFFYTVRHTTVLTFSYLALSSAKLGAWAGLRFIRKMSTMKFLLEGEKTKVRKINASMFVKLT